MNKIVRGALLGCALLFSLFTTAASAQNGTVSGSVVSANGSPLANVTVVLEHATTGARLNSTSDASGNYRFDNVPSGTYRMTTSTATMQGTVSGDVVVDAARAKTVNITMQNPSTTAPTTAALITVQDATPIQGLDSPQIRATWNTRDTQYLPSPNFIDRNGELYGALNLSLQNIGAANQTGLGPGRGPIVGGQRPVNNNYMLEGVDNNNRANPGPLVYVPPDATTEFLAYQNQFPADYGQSTGGQFNILARTGTDQFHGALYEYLQNRNLNAIDPALARQGFTDNSRYDQNRLGGNLGFPILKNRLFFFGDFEWVPLGVANTPISPVYGPTAAGYAALSGITGVSQTNLGVLRQYLPAAANATRTTTVNGVQIPLGVVPLTGRNFQNAYYGTGSLDWKIGNSDNLRARYVQNEIDASGTGSQIAAFSTPVTTRSLIANVSEYHNLGARGVNELRLAYTRYQNMPGNSSLTFPGLDVFPNISIQQDLGVQLGQGYLGVATAGLNTYQLSDSVNWIIGSHTIRFGADARRYIGPLNLASRGLGTYLYSNLQGFALDQPPDVFGARSFGNLTYSGNQWSASGYVSDTWHLRPGVSLNLGVRYDYVTVPNGLKPQALNSIADVPGILQFREPDTQKTAFAPRIGLAISPTKMHNTVFRLGFGMNYDSLSQSFASSLPTVPPGTTTTEFVRTITPFVGFFNSGAIVNVFPVNVFTPSVTPDQARAVTTTYIPDQKLPYTMQWDAGIQQTVYNRFVLDLRYLGVKGVHIPVQDLLNRTSPVTAATNLPLYYSQPAQAELNALPNTLSSLQQATSNPLASAGFTSPIYTVRPDGTSFYNGLLVQGTERFSGGFQMRASYTWSHLLDDVSAPNLFNPGSLNLLGIRGTRQTSLYDHRHVASLTALWDLGGIGANSYHWVREAVANMTLSGTYNYQSPAQIPLSSGIDASLGGGFAASSVFVNPNGVAGTGSGVTPLTNSSGQTVAYLASNPNAQFIQAGRGSFPTGGNAFVPGLRPINNFDVAAFKRFAIRDRFRVEVHGEAYNVLNHAQYVPGSLTSIGFGAQPHSYNFLIPGSASFADPTQAFSGHPRTLQVGLRVIW